MSTYYHPLTPPITSVRVDAESSPVHDFVSVWVNGAKAGKLTVRSEETSSLLRALSAGRDVAQVFAAGRGRTALKVFDGGIDPDDVLISEYGEVTTLRELRGRVDKIVEGI